MNKKINVNEILEGKHPTFQTAKLKVKLLKSGIKTNECEECGQKEIWNGKKLIMHLDHINGKSDDHRLENLKMLCPNCHSQTETYAGKNKSNEIRLKIEEKKKLRKEKVLLERIKKENIEQERLNIIKQDPKERGWVMKLSRQLNLSHTHIRRLYYKIK
jgi:Zn finger protein HypA/HybF involved in hydrogenase expression